MRRFITAVIIIGHAAVFTVRGDAARAQPQVSYEVLVPADIAVNPATDRLVITARSTSATELTLECARSAGSYPTHAAVVDGEQEVPIAGVIVIAAEGLRPGTVLAGLTESGSCVENGVQYAKFVGLIQ